MEVVNIPDGNRPELSHEIRNGKEVVVMPVEEFNQQFRRKRKSQKQRMLEANNIDLKYLKNIQYQKKDGVYSFKIFSIPSIEELKKMIEIQETYLGHQN